LRNLAITVLRLTGETSIAAALRRNARRPGRCRRNRSGVQTRPARSLTG